MLHIIKVLLLKQVRYFWLQPICENVIFISVHNYISYPAPAGNRVRKSGKTFFIYPHFIKSIGQIILEVEAWKKPKIEIIYASNTGI